MNILNKLITNIILILSICIIPSCKTDIGGISITASNIIINDTTFDTDNLKIISGDIKGDINYCIKIVGHTNPVDDYTWDKWFKNQESDIYGKLIVCLKLELSNNVINDPDSTINLPINSENKENINSYKINAVKDGNNFIYLILNPRHDLINITINYTEKNTPKSIKYLIDLMDVNATVSGALE